MKKGENTNRPKKGDMIKVEPIRDLKSIKAIKKLLADNPRNLCLFTLGINTNLRASDLLRITAGDVRHLKVGDTLNLKEKKTDKHRAIVVNKAVVDAVQRLLKSRQYQDSDLLFVSQRGEGRIFYNEESDADYSQITAGDVRHLKVGDTLNLKEKKTDKSIDVEVTERLLGLFHQLLKTRSFDDEDLLFELEQRALTVPSVNRLVKEWCKAINLPGNYGSHTLRKTFGYHQRVTVGTGIAELMIMFNHSSQKQTLDYLGVQPDEIKNAYLRLEL
jgi:integrase